MGRPLTEIGGRSLPSTPRISSLGVLLLAALTFGHVVRAGAGDPYGGCSYSFQVWRPDQDVLGRMEELERSCHNTSIGVEYQLVLLKNQLVEEVMRTHNASHRLEKDILDQRLQHLQHEVTVKDIQLELVDLRGSNRKLWEVVDILQRASGQGQGHNDGQGQGQGSIYGRGGGMMWVGLVSPADVEEVKATVSKSTEVTNQLKNSVGDLKAEWLLIKREVTEARAEALQNKVTQSDVRADTVKLKAQIEGLRTEAAVVKRRVDGVVAAQDKLGRAQEEARNSPTSTRSKDGEMSNLNAELMSFRDRLNHADNELAKVKSQREMLTQEVITAAMETGNLTAEQVLDLLPSLYLTEAANNKHKGIPRDCHDIYRQGHTTSGVYQIQPDGLPQLDNVYCEMVNSTGWTVVQRRQDGTLSFNRRWMEYKHGFGSLYGEFWLGNEWLHHLTRQKAYRLRVDMWDWEGHRAYAEFDFFRIDSEEKKYTLHVRGYRGNAGDSLSYHDNVAFSTEDSDNDLHMRNCAMENKGGWWFNSCYSSHLNGVYHTGRYSKASQTFADGIVWYTWKKSDFYSLRRTELKLRPMYL